MTRDEKIKLAITAMQQTVSRRFGVRISETNLVQIVQMAEAVVDALDPPKRIDLGGCFHAEPGETPGHPHDVYYDHIGRERFHVGQLSKAAVEGWASLAATGHYKDGS